MDRIAIFTADSNGGYPVPATRGGAVSTLIEHLIKENSKNKKIDLEIISFFEKKAYEESKKYENVKFIWIKVPLLFRLLDEFTFKIVKTFFKKEKSLSYKSIFSLIYYIKKSKNLVKKNNYEKVILENNIPLALIIKLSKYRGKYYYHLHNIPRLNLKCKSVFDNCNGYLCVSKFVAQQIMLASNPIGPIDIKKIKILYNCVDTEKFYKIRNETILMKYKNKFNVKKNEKIVLFVGRISEEKGIDKLLEAINILKDKKIKVLIVGSYIHNYKDKSEYQEKIRKLSECISQNVIMTGYIKQEELVYLYNISDVVVLPSMWDEPAGLTMLEALACGANVISTYSGGIPEYIDKHGVLIERNEELSKKIAENIKRILDSGEEQEKGILRVEENFSTEKYLTKFVEAIK